jgi:hypothetical protein
LSQRRASKYSLPNTSLALLRLGAVASTEAGAELGVSVAVFGAGDGVTESRSESDWSGLGLLVLLFIGGLLLDGAVGVDFSTAGPAIRCWH